LRGKKKKRKKGMRGDAVSEIEPGVQKIEGRKRAWSKEEKKLTATLGQRGPELIGPGKGPLGL